MFIHGKTGKIYYSIKEKIDYYEKIVRKEKTDVPITTKRKAPLRLKTLKKLDQRTFDEPTLVVTDDKFFGNGISKSRPVVVVDKRNDGKFFVAPLQHVTSKQVVLDNNIGYQVSKTADGKNKWISKNDIYETKNLSSLKSLSKNDKRKIKDLYKK